MLYFWFGVVPGGNQGLLLALPSDVTLGMNQETMRGAWDQTRINSMQNKHPT